MTIPTHALHPAYVAAMGPAAEMLAGMPRLPAGDVQGRRSFFTHMFAAMPDMGADPPPEVRETIYEVKSKDGTTINLHRFFLKKHEGQAGSAVLHIHGGGLILGSVAMTKKNHAEKVLESGVQHFSVEYRLSPEAQYPAPLEDCYAALIFIRDNAAAVGVDPTRIGIHGESAGGGLAAGLALLARDRHFSPPIKRQILIYPMIDDRSITPDPAIEDLTIWRAADNETGWGAYLGDQKSSPDGYAVPARATDLRGLPPAYIDVGTLDLFRDENIDYVGKLVKAGVPVEFHLLPGLPHGWELFKPDVPEIREIFAARLRAIQSL